MTAAATTTTTSGAADLRATCSEMLVDLPNTEPYTLLKAGFDAALAAGQATAAPENIRGILTRCRDFIDTTKVPAYPSGADLSNEIDALLAAPQPSHAAQAAVPADLITIRKPTTSAEMLWLLKLAHLVISDMDKTLEKTFAPAQPAAQQGVAYAALPEPDATTVGLGAVWNRHSMRDFADATHMLRASHGEAPAGAAEEIDKALNVYAQAFAARVNGWTRQNGDDLPGARSALFAAIHAYARASTRPAASPQADSVQEDAACWHWLAEYLVGPRTDLDDEIVASETVNDLRKLVNAAIKQGEKQ